MTRPARPKPDPYIPVVDRIPEDGKGVDGRDIHVFRDCAVEIGPRPQCPHVIFHESGLVLTYAGATDDTQAEMRPARGRSIAETRAWQSAPCRIAKRVAAVGQDIAGPRLRHREHAARTCHVQRPPS
jgi:hypothetical protein